MRTRLLVLVLTCLLVSAAKTSAQTSTPAVPSVVLSPPAGDLLTVHQIQLHGMVPGSDVLIVLFDPA